MLSVKNRAINMNTKTIKLIWALIVTLLIVSFGKTHAAETVSKDTVFYPGAIAPEKIIKENSKTGERKVYYYVRLADLNNKKVRTDKRSYDLWDKSEDDVLNEMKVYLIYNNKSDGSRTLTKAIFVTSK